MPAAHKLQRLSASVAVLAGWLWLGWQGMRLGWPLAGGLGVVALWWGLRLLCSRWASVAGRLRGWSWPLGAATGAGVLGVQGAGLGQEGLPVLLATAGTWALWSVALAPPPTQEAPPKPVHNAAPPTLGNRSTAAPNLAAAQLPTTAMGLMMGTLWLSSQWCATAGWPAPVWLAMHVALMVLLPVLLRGPAQALQAHPFWREALPLALLALGGACVLASASPTGWMLGMALQVLAWVLGRSARLSRTAAAHATPATTGVSCAGPLTIALALCGPLLLGLVGTLSTTAGPQALHHAQAGLGALALLALLHLWWRSTRIPLPWSPTPST